MRGLFFNPLNILATLDFQKTLNDNEITLTPDEKKNIDQIIFDGLVYQHCSDNIKNIIKTLKSTQVYSDTSQVFDLLNKQLYKLMRQKFKVKKLLTISMSETGQPLGEAKLIRLGTISHGLPKAIISTITNVVLPNNPPKPPQ